jgi:hypothetical protein
MRATTLLAVAVAGLRPETSDARPTLGSTSGALAASEHPATTNPGAKTK